MPEIEYRIHGKIARVQADPHDTLLDSALRNGIDAPYSCMEGVCETCRARLIEGGVVAPPGSGLMPNPDGSILTCQMRPDPKAPRIVIEF